MRLFFLKLFFVSLFFFNFVCAGEINVDYPSEIETNSEFSFKIKLIDFPEDNYDVKIDLISDGVRISRIFDSGKWKSTIYYVNNIIKNNEEKTFKLRTENFSGKAEILIRIRDSKNKIFEFIGYSIEIKEKVQEIEKKDDEKEEPNDEIFIKNSEENFIKEKENEQSFFLKKPIENNEIGLEQEKIEKEVISIGTKNIKRENVSEKSERNTGFFWLVSFFILICFLIYLKNKKTNFEKNLENI